MKNNTVLSPRALHRRWKTKWHKREQGRTFARWDGTRFAEIPRERGGLWSDYPSPAERAEFRRQAGAVAKQDVSWETAEHYFVRHKPGLYVVHHGVALVPGSSGPVGFY